MSKDSEIFDTAPLIGQALRAQVAAFMELLSAKGFKDMTSAFATLIPLVDDKGARSIVLAQRAGVTKQAMSQLIRLVEKRGYVEQVPDPTDTRAKVVRLTKRGVVLRAACLDVRRQLHAAAIRALGQKDLGVLQKNLKRLIASMSELTKEPPGSSC